MIGMGCRISAPKTSELDSRWYFALGSIAGGYSARRRVAGHQRFGIQPWFYMMMMPYLAQHLGGTLGLAGWASGLIMGMRVFSQQGFVSARRYAGDRIGYRPAIIWGCLVRSFGFALLGWAEHLPLLLLAAFLTGFAGALFTPALTSVSGGRNVVIRTSGSKHFALHNLASEAGMLLGPLVGLLLTNLSYTMTGLVSGGVFSC